MRPKLLLHRVFGERIFKLGLGMGLLHLWSELRKFQTGSHFGFQIFELRMFSFKTLILCPKGFSRHQKQQQEVK